MGKKDRVSATQADLGLLIRACTELGRGRLTEARIDDVQTAQCNGYMEHGHITINPVHATVDTLIHELMHRLYPRWSEHYVRIRTGRLMTLLSGALIQAIYDEYQIQVKRRKSPKIIEEDA